ncbi:hypothetical protein Pcinc_024721 [Petrolisthes cinctipes]|uniref:Beta-1,4-glucuronyltransferase 1 n=1 Tax=Petrolisthes cinctipes TaxID=88211 RepID=A0AAE1FAQ0_PETCI|nr:hypothetical protein Pcinc_024721 [Petrolisthes cinctipes]
MDSRPGQVDVSLHQLNEVDTSLSQMDSSRKFKTHQFLVVGREWQRVSRRWQVCLCTQTTVENIFWIVQHTGSWAGPFSVVIFAPSYDYSVAVAMITYLQRCKVEVLQYVAFHLTYPVDLPPQLANNTWRLSADFSCNMNPEEVNMKLVEMLRPAIPSTYLKESLYPQNMLRNVARSTCNMKFAFLVDMDMILVKNIDFQLNNFLERNSSKECSKCAFIIPTYEIHTNVTHNPENKHQLLQLLNKKLARRYHEKSFFPNQGNSRLEKWEKLNSTSEFGIGYVISKYKLQWEPLYIIQGDIPDFDERFIGYGFVRSSQVLEMHLAGFSWHMLNNAFTCHRGFQEKTQDPIRIYQTKQNAARFMIFLEEKLVRYQNTEDSLQ